MQYSTKEVAEKVNRAVRTVQIAIKKLNIPTEKVGRNNIIDEDGLAILVNHFQTLDKKYYNTYAVDFNELQSEEVTVCDEEYHVELVNFKSFIEEIYNENRNNTITIWINHLNRARNYIENVLGALNIDYTVTRNREKQPIRILIQRPSRNIKILDFVRFTGVKPEKLSEVYDVNPEDHLVKQMMEIALVHKAGHADSINSESYKRLMDESFGSMENAKRKLPKAVDSRHINLQKYFQLVEDARNGGLLYKNNEYVNELVHNVTYVDINSSYPNVMKNNLLPYGHAHQFNGNPDDLNLKENTWFLVRVLLSDIKLKPGKFPYLGYSRINRIHHHGQVDKITAYEGRGQVYNTKPGYVYETVVTRDEIALIKECYDLKIQYLDGQWHYAMQGLFANFVNKYYEIKKNATGSAREQAKLFINMSYGMLNVSIFEKKVDNKGIIDWKKSMFNVYKETYAPAGLAILFGARVNLGKALNMNAENVLYCDTDSIIIKDAPKGITISKELGEWKVEESNVDFKCVAFKTYIVGSRVVTAGVPAEYNINTTMDDFHPDNVINVMRYSSNENGIYTYEFKYTFGGILPDIQGSDIYE